MIHSRGQNLFVVAKWKCFAAVVKNLQKRLWLFSKHFRSDRDNRSPTQLFSLSCTGNCQMRRFPVDNPVFIGKNAWSQLLLLVWDLHEFKSMCRRAATCAWTRRSLRLICWLNQLNDQIQSNFLTEWVLKDVTKEHFPVHYHNPKIAAPVASGLDLLGNLQEIPQQFLGIRDYSCREFNWLSDKILNPGQII